MSRFWKGPEQLFSFLQVGKTFFEQLLEVMLELPPFKRHGLLTDATKLPPTPLPEGPLGPSNPLSSFHLVQLARECPCVAQTELTRMRRSFSQLTALQWDNGDAKEYLLKGRTFVKKKIYIQAHIITTAYHAFIFAAFLITSGTALWQGERGLVNKPSVPPFPSLMCQRIGYSPS